MKKIIFIAGIISIALSANAQKLKESQVPADVKTSFHSLYPDTKVLKWEKEDGKFEAEFKQDKVETSVLFEENGTYYQTETEIPVSSLPQSIKDYALKNSTGNKIKEATKITDAAGKITYEAEIGKQDYIFDENGNFLKKESDEDKGDED